MCLSPNFIAYNSSMRQYPQMWIVLLSGWFVMCLMIVDYMIG